MPYGTIDRQFAMQLGSRPPEDDGPVYMLNLMKYRDEADYGEGGETGVTGREADDRYAPVEILTEIGAAVCFFGDVVASSEDWDRVGIVRYPSRRAFIEMQSMPRFKDRHRHKEAGMDRTIVMATLPLGALPTATDRVLVELWSDGDAPDGGSDAGGDASVFGVEGTLIGDGRAWTGVRYVPFDGELDLSGTGPSRQRIVVAATLQAWG